MALAREVRARIAAVLNQPAERVRDDVELADLVVESLALVEMAIDLQEDFDVRLGHEELARVKTVGDLVGLVARP
jgi:acyl carrier protein